MKLAATDPRRKYRAFHQDNEDASDMIIRSLFRQGYGVDDVRAMTGRRIGEIAHVLEGMGNEFEAYRAIAGRRS